MVRAFVVTVCLAAPLASAQLAPAPTSAPTPTPAPAASATRPVQPMPTTKPTPEQLHAQAYAFMSAEKFDKATPLLNRAYNETPPAQRSRALVLNRALLDLVQKQNVMRGVKELHEYLTRDTTPDEQASNIFGASIDLAANNARWRDGPIYAAALREFARRQAALERARPGFRRWGAEWITEEELQAIKQKQKEQAEQAAEAYNVLVARNNDLKSVTVQYANARTQFGGFRNHRHQSVNGRTPYRTDCPQCTAFLEARESVNVLSAELNKVTQRVNQAQREYDTLAKRQIKPTWPAKFPPIDPSAPPPAVPLPPTSQRAFGAATQPTGVAP